jgi:3-phytase
MMRLVPIALLLVSLGARAEAPYLCLANDMDAIASTQDGQVRFATFNSFLNRFSAGSLTVELMNGGSPQVMAIAEIVQRVRPDVLLLNEFDFEPSGTAVALFQRNYLELSQNGESPIYYPYVYLAESNTGLPSGLNFDNGDTDGDGNPSNDAGDAFGFGSFPGQYGMALLSRHPIETHRVRTFQKFRWRDMPGALLPDDPTTAAPADWYSEQELSVFRLSSKSHWDIPIQIDGRVVHVLAAHPTPPVFDDPPGFPAGVDFNGRRNHDEIRFWADYVSGPKASRYIYDDRGYRGGLARREAFVILGDYNADPNDGDSTNDAIEQLLRHPAIATTVAPAALGGVEDALRASGLKAVHVGNPALDTGDFNPAAPGNLRADYVLPSRQGLRPSCGGVFWPGEADATFPLVGEGFPVVSSDHHLVWLDVGVREPWLDWAFDDDKWTGGDDRGSHYDDRFERSDRKDREP